MAKDRFEFVQAFAFRLQDKVKTPFCDIGIIDVLAVDGEGVKYFIVRNQNSQWFKESQLSPAE